MSRRVQPGDHDFSPTGGSDTEGVPCSGKKTRPGVRLGSAGTRRGAWKGRRGSDAEDSWADPAYGTDFVADGAASSEHSGKLRERVHVHLIAGIHDSVRRQLIQSLIDSTRLDLGMGVVVTESRRPLRLNRGGVWIWTVADRFYDPVRPDGMTGLFEDILDEVRCRRIFIEVPATADPAHVQRALFALAEDRPRLFIEPVVLAASLEGIRRLDGLAADGRSDDAILRHYKAANVVVLQSPGCAHLDRKDCRLDAIARTNPRAWILCMQDDLAPLRFLVAEEGETFCLGELPKGYSAFSLNQPDRAVRRDKLEQVLRRLPDELFRIRGHVETEEGSFELNYVGGIYDLEPAPDLAGCRLTFVGRDISSARIMGQFRRCFR